MKPAARTVHGLFLTLLIAASTHAQQPSTWHGVDLWRKWPSSTGDATNPSELGFWAPPTPIDLPNHELPKLYGVHASLLYNGEDERLLIFRNDAILFDLRTTDQRWVLNLTGTGEPVPTPNGHEPFCSGYVPLEDGRLFIVGTSFWRFWTDPPDTTEGLTMLDGKASIFDPANPSEDLEDIGQYWITTDEIPDAGGQFLGGNFNPSNCGQNSCWGGQSPLSKARYYPTCLRLDDGRILVASGDFWVDCDCDHEQNSDPLELDQQNKWLIYDHSAPAGFRWSWDNHSLTDLDGFEGDETFTNPWVAQSELQGNPFQVSYPRMKLLPFGLFYAGNDSAIVTTAAPSFLWTPLSDWSSPGADFIENAKRQNRFTGGCVVLTLDAASTDISVLMVGGGADVEQPDGLPKLGSGAEIITYRQDSQGQVTALSPGWEDTEPMNSSMGRTDGNTVLLPDGTVLAIGGEEGAHSEDQNRSCEIFTPNLANPADGTWTLAAELGADRGHHSVAVLLPDGRVFSTGHENHHSGQGHFGTDYQVFYPPYLFDGSEFAERDTIETAPEVVRYGLPFEITLRDGEADDIEEVALMAPCSPTHGIDFSQSRVLLAHAPVPGEPDLLVVSAPKDSTYAPPGYYMLFVLANGVPSEAKWVKVERPDNTDYLVPNGVVRRWGGDVWLDRDFEIAPGGTLHILKGARIHVKGNVSHSSGISPKVEIICRGHLVAPGSFGEFIDIRTYEGTDAAGEWYGIRFVGAPVEGSETAMSYVTIRNAFRAVTVDTLGFGFSDCKFAKSQEADVYIDRDFRIPEGKEWKIPAPAKLLVKDSDAAPKPWGQDGFKSEILVEGALRTYRPEGGSASDSVRFVATALGPSKWTGITIGEDATGEIYDAIIGGATDPVAFLGAASARVWHSRIFDIGEVGILDWASNAWIKNCTLRKAIGGNPSRTGIHLISSTGRVESNDVGYMESRGIRAEFNATICNASVPGDTLVIGGNTVTGIYTTGARGSSVGISLERGCDHRHPRIRYNTVKKWSKSALEVIQCAETRVSYNVLNDSHTGIEYIRNTNATGGTNRVYRNDLLSNEKNNVLTAESHALAFREAVQPDSAGNNRLRQKVDNTWHISASDPLEVIDAQLNLWLDHDGTPLTTEAEIRETLEESPAGRVNVARWLTSGGGPEAPHSRGERLAAEPEALSGETATSLGREIPVEFGLGPARPNPFSDSVEIQLAVPDGSRESLRLDVFDVTGRVVRRLADKAFPPGFHSVQWNGVAADGRPVAAGIYFVRMEAPEFRETLRVVMLNRGDLR